MTPEQVAEANDELVRSYRLCFGSPAGQAVMRDLVVFCRAAQTTVEGDKPILLLEGRRQVFLRIQNFMSLMPDELVQLAVGRSIRQGGE